VGRAAAGAGMLVLEHPLMVLAPERAIPARPPRGIEVRLLTEGDDLRVPQALAMVAFAHPGTEAGPAGPEALAEEAAKVLPDTAGFLGRRLARGLTVVAAAFVGDDPVGVGSHQPVGSVTEVAGVGVLPTFRRTGIGAAITWFLVQDARRRGVETVFLSAGDATIGRVYEGLGFRTVGRAGAAELPEA
ncbi:MAG: GNAT family N-acetyltransferase, partial [Actinomycetota bacterium]